MGQFRLAWVGQFWLAAKGQSRRWQGRGIEGALFWRKNQDLQHLFW